MTSQTPESGTIKLADPWPAEEIFPLQKEAIMPTSSDYFGDMTKVTVYYMKLLSVECNVTLTWFK